MGGARINLWDVLPEGDCLYFWSVQVVIIGQENIAEIFSVFHDGGIDRYVLQDGRLDLWIEIPYLAERINSEFSCFKISLSGVGGIAFRPWLVADEEPVFVSMDEAFQLELGILWAEVVGGAISIGCDQCVGDMSAGGNLFIEAQAAEVSDEAGTFYSLEELVTLANGYWNEFARR